MNLPIFIKALRITSKTDHDTTAHEAKWSFPSALLAIKYCTRQMEKAHAQIMAWIEVEYKYLNEDMKKFKAHRELAGELETTFTKEQSNYFAKKA
ncbi:3-oxoacyl-[acyl-carrier-protein] synthase [Massospora cicadina]|nr:3-oxoacyl-[acyl-carrier-protein] synthase [Massospora cicadina]